MELNEDFIKKNEFSAEQVDAIKQFGTEYTTNLTADLKKEFDGKANEQAEGILSGAAKKITELTSIERLQGEKVGDFMLRAWDDYSKTGNETLEAKQKELDEKIKNFKGDPEVTKELISLRDKLDGLQQKEAQFDELLNSGVKDKYEELQGKYDSMQKKVAFGMVKPTFSKDANEYEVAAKWNAFQDSVMNDYDIVLVDNEPTAVAKDNKYRTVKLKDLIDQNSELTELVKGRQQAGINATSTDLKEVDGIPFALPTDGDSQKLTQAVQQYLKKEGIETFDSGYSKKFAELYNKAKAATQKTAQIS